ncbi:MAG TPA: NHL repeat-containing protein, partial [Anaerolineales bacterium]|nr:NHL repeat-containing protein [Anaerolineales bacterium]
IGNGEEGQGAGFFDDTRAVAVDGQGNIYTADYDGGRVQIFDSVGNFVNMWKIPGQAYISGLAADRAGNLYVVFGGNVYRYEGATGTRLGKMKYDESFVYDVAVSPFGDVVAASNQAIIRFDREGQITLKIDQWPELVGAGSSASLSNLAVDGEGSIYVGDSSASIVYKLSAEGRFLDRIGVPGDGPGKLDGVYALAADGQRRLYVADSDGIEVLDENGLPVGTIEVESLVFDMAVSGEQELIAMDRNANKLFKFKLP